MAGRRGGQCPIGLVVRGGRCRLGNGRRSRSRNAWQSKRVHKCRAAALSYRHPLHDRGRGPPCGRRPGCRVRARLQLCRPCRCGMRAGRRLFAPSSCDRAVRPPAGIAPRPRRTPRPPDTPRGAAIPRSIRICAHPRYDGSAPRIGSASWTGLMPLSPTTPCTSFRPSAAACRGRRPAWGSHACPS